MKALLATAVAFVVSCAVAPRADAAMIWKLDFDTADVYAYGEMKLAGINGSSLDQVKSFELYVSPGGYFGFHLTKDDLSYASWRIDKTLYAFFSLSLHVTRFEHEPGLFVDMIIDEWSYPQDLHTIVFCEDEVTTRCGGLANENFVGFGQSTFVGRAPAPATAMLLVTGLAVVRRRREQAQGSSSGTR